MSKMSKIDVLIIVHNEHEGLLSVGNSERAHYGMVAHKSVIGVPVNPVIWQSGIPAFIRDSLIHLTQIFLKKLYWQATGTIIKAAATLCKCIL